MADANPLPGSIAFIASSADEAQAALVKLAGVYGNTDPANATHVVALGGDGFMLQALHQFMSSGKPIYGMNCGTIGFLMNEFGADDLIARLGRAITTPIHPLVMTAWNGGGTPHTAYAFNEVSLLRQSYQAAHLKIVIDDKLRLAELICDGVLVATAAGSTAYNLSAHGPILPINAPLLALTPISPFRPRSWRGALLPDHSRVHIDVLDAGKRPVNAVGDHTEIKSVTAVDIVQSKTDQSLIMFDPDHSWDERILNEQFRY
jgi:NAD+ kinase